MDRPLLYIHGFASSGHSHKGRLLAQHFEQVFTPSLPTIPALAIDTLEQFITALGRPALVGSSLGGLYALHLSAIHHLPAVLVNPALHFDATLAHIVGMNRHYYDGSRFEFTDDHLATLQGLHRLADPAQVLLMVEMGDELLDHRRTLAALPGVRTVAEPGGDHAYSRFAEHLPLVREFLAEA